MTYDVVHISNSIARLGSMVAPLAALPLHIAVRVLFAGLSLYLRGRAGMIWTAEETFVVIL